MPSDERIVQSILRFGCLYLAVEMCKTANAFDRPNGVMDLARQLENYCLGTEARSEPAKRS